MKYLAYIVVLFILPWLYSCSQDEMSKPEGWANTGKNVSITVALPGEAIGTRATIEIPVTHKLRGILEVWSTDDVPALIYRDEKTALAGSMPDFTFQLESGEYNCLLWADFIPKENEASEAVKEGVAYRHFADGFYNTEDLSNVSVKDASDLFDTDLCDAYFGQITLDYEVENVNTVVTLARPFGKLTVEESDVEALATLKGMSVECTSFTTFNVVTGEPTSRTTTARLEKVFDSGNTDSELFSYYFLLPSNEEGTPLETIELNFETEDGSKGGSIASGRITLQRNEHKTAKGTLIAGSGEVVLPTEKPKIGDFFFYNGTWGTELTEANKGNCIGIVFATGTGENDNAEQYGATEILAYVMALDNVTGTVVSGETGNSNRFYMYRQKTATAPVKFATEENRTAYNGYELTTSYLSSEQYASALEWTYPVLTALQTYWTVGTPENSSPWYVPSFAQLHDIIAGCYGVDGIKANEALSAAYNKVIDMGLGRRLNLDGSKKRPCITSSLNDNGEALMIQLKPDGTDVSITSGTSGSVGYIRPVLTIVSK